MPFRLAFVEEDVDIWAFIEVIIDMSFNLDLVINFFTAYYKEEDEILILSKKVIYILLLS